jgi:ATP synthase protein I
MTDSFERDGWGEGESDAPFRRLTPQEAQALRARLPVVSPWRVVGAQAVAGLLVSLASWGLSGEASVGWSALYGAAAVVLPSAVLARGIGRLSGAGPAAEAVGFLVWEGVKVFLAVAMLVAAVRVVPSLSWPALLVAAVVCLKVNWLALLWRGRVKVDASR